MMNTLLIALLAGTASQADVPSQARAGEPDEVVVTGQRHLSQEKAQQAVNAISDSRDLQIARFHDEVCPMVVGLPAQSAQVVEGQIRSIAQQVGARVGGAKCTANLIVILASDGNAMFNDIRRNRREWLAGVSTNEINSLMRQHGPVRAWSVTSLRNEDGRIAGRSTEGAKPQATQVRSASILSEPMRQHIDGSVMIIERAAVKGRTLGEIAHYAAMRGLAMTRLPKEGQGVSSILRLFDASDAAAPRSLTSFDMSYLKALYASKGHDRAVTERSRIARSVARTN